MDAQQYVEALRKRWLTVVAFALIGLLGGLAFAATQPRLYQATSSVYVASQPGTSAVEQLQGATFAQDIVQTYVELATQPVVLDPVVQQLALPETSAQLAKRVKASLTINTVIITVTVTDGSPKQAAKIADAITASLSTAASNLSATSKKPAIVMHPVANATAPTQASSPNWPFILASGLGIGLLLGLALALGRQILDTKIGSSEQLRGLDGLQGTPFLGALSHRKGKKRAANVMLAEPHGPAAEEYRRVATNLEFAGIDRQIHSVTVTSALPGEGKSTTALNLATAVAERSRRVLLMDGDLRRPSVAEYLGLDATVGLTDVLLGKAAAERAVQRVGEVDVLPSGTLPPNVTQLVTSETMARLFGELLARYDFVVVDAPPLLPVIDALTFSKLTDGALVVARQGVTRKKQFALAIESLVQVEAVVVGTLLNDVGKSADGNAYGYGYLPREAAPARTEQAPSTTREPFFPEHSTAPAAGQTQRTAPRFADR